MKTNFENSLQHQAEITLCTFLDLGLRDQTLPGQSILQPGIFTHFAHFQFRDKIEMLPKTSSNAAKSPKMLMPSGR